MSYAMKMRLTVLIEQELRTAAIMCAEVQRLQREHGSEEDISAAVIEAYQACATALYGADKPNAILMITSHAVSQTEANE